MDELRRRQALAQAHGRRRQGQAPARRRASSRCASASTGCSTRAPSTRSAHHRQGRVRRPQRPRGPDAGQLRVRPRQIDGRPVVVAGDDFTVRGGAADAVDQAEADFAEQMGERARVPIVRLIDGTGGGGSVKTIETTGRTYVPGNRGWEWVVANLATVPAVALGLGSVAGLGAARLAATHYSVMVKGISQMFVAGPPVVARARRAGRPRRSSAAARSTRATARSTTRSPARPKRSRGRGASSRTCRRRSTACRARRRSNDDPSAPRGLADRRDPARPAQGLRMRPIVETPASTAAASSRSAQYGRSVITGLARLDGWPVAVLASDPYLLRRRLDGRRLPEGHALRRLRRDVPSAGRAPRRHTRAS